MMQDNEISLVKKQVKDDLIPEIKKLIPGVIAFILRKVFPKIEDKVVAFILKIAEVLIANRL